MKKVIVILLVMMLIFTTLTACNTTTGTDEPEQEEPQEEGSEGEEPEQEEPEVVQEFTFGGRNDLMTLDVSQMNDEMSALVMYGTNEGLVRYSQGNIEMGIAESYDVSDDGTVYTFNLRDANWSDGEPVTAYDYEYSFLRTLDPATGSSQVNEFDSILNAKKYSSEEIDDKTQVGVKALDEKTLEITLEQEDPFFLSQLAQGINFYPIRQDYVEEHGNEYGASPESFIGCGPYVLTEWNQAASIVMEKNENYWNKDEVKLEKVTELIVPDENTLVGMYDLGDVDAVYSISKVQTEKYTDYKTKIGGTLQYLSFNSAEGNVLENKNLRKALSYAINRKSIVDAVASPGSSIAYQMIDPSINIDGEPVVELYPNSTGIDDNGSLDEAKEYLDAALNDLGLASTEELPTIEYVCMDSTTHKQYAEALQAQWEQNLGVVVEIKTLPVPQAIGSLLGGEFDIFLVSQSTGVHPDTLLKGFTIGNGNNYSNWENQEYTDLIAQQAEISNIEEKLSNLQKAEEIILEESPVTPLWLPGTAYLSKDYVKNLYYGRQTGSIEFIYSYIE